MEIDHLMRRFAELGPSAKIGHGPEHPTMPDPHLAHLVSRWIDIHPCLLHDPTYVAFLKRYAGAEVDVPEQGFGVSIAGFTGIGGDLHEKAPFHFDITTPAVDDRGFYAFASLDVQLDEKDLPKRSKVMDFFLDATNARKWGVYRSIRLEDEESWYCETFAQWLQRVIDQRGKLL